MDNVKDENYKMENNKNQLVVTIRCLAYNHEPYIRQCLEGFIMQKTNFRFEAIVHDDASTDKTATIIREYAEKYPNIIKPIFEKENQYSKHDGSLGKIMDEQSHGKYIAVCEGDDYWIDPYKLQKQVDFLELHPDYGLVRTDINEYYQDEDRILKNCISSDKRYKGIRDTHKGYIFYGWFAAPCTWLYRSEFLKEISNFRYKYKDVKMFKGDLLVLLIITKNSKIKYLNETTAVYRILDNSASHFNDKNKMLKFWLYVYKLRKSFAKDENFLFRIKFYIYNFICFSYLKIFK